jgi:hypothetical protein
MKEAGRWPARSSLPCRARSLLLVLQALFALPAVGCLAGLEHELSLTDYVKVEVALCCPTAAVRVLWS